MKPFLLFIFLGIGVMLNAAQIVIISDSTAVDYRSKPNPYTKGETGWAPMSGWGEFVADACRPGVTVVNRSVGGESSRTYWNRRMKKTKAFFEKDGWLLLSFGSNDARPSGKTPERTTTPDGTYPEFLGLMVKEAKAAGMHVVIISPPVFYHMVDGKFSNPVLQPYAVACKRFAEENGCEYIDLFSAMCDRFANCTDEEIRTHYMFLKRGESPNWPKGRNDPLHFTQKGSRLIWSILHAEIERRIPELAKCFQPVQKPPVP